MARMQRNEYGRTEEVTVRENAPAAQHNGLAQYETLHITEQNEIAWGAHFGGHHDEAGVMNVAGLLGLEWLESMNFHDSDYHYFGIPAMGKVGRKVDDLYPKFEKFLQEKMGGIKEHPKYGRT